MLFDEFFLLQNYLVFLTIILWNPPQVDDSKVDESRRQAGTSSAETSEVSGAEAPSPDPPLLTQKKKKRQLFSQVLFGALCPDWLCCYSLEKYIKLNALQLPETEPFDGGDTAHDTREDGTTRSSGKSRLNDQENDKNNPYEFQNVRYTIHHYSSNFKVCAQTVPSVVLWTAQF